GLVRLDDHLERLGSVPREALQRFAQAGRRAAHRQHDGDGGSGGHGARSMNALPYTAMVRTALVRAEKSGWRARAAAESFARSAGSVATSTMRSAISCASTGSNITAASPAISGSDVAREQATGFPAMIASAT